jgi:hypothetical protein
LLLATGVVFTALAHAQVSLTQLSEDTFSDTPSQHDTEVEPSTFSYGSTIVTAFQVARISAEAAQILASPHQPMAA